MDIKKSLADLAPTVEQKLDAFWQAEIAKKFGFNRHERELVDKMLAHAREHNLRPGKRLRAALTYYGYMLGLPDGQKPGENIWPAAISVELVHTSLLMHDDFMDKDDIRRGLATTHKFFGASDAHYGACMALNLGDVVLTLGYEALARAEFPAERVNRAVRLMLRNIVNTGWGQVLDTSLEKISDPDEDDVIAVDMSKTAIYTYENPLNIGATLAGLGSDVQAILSRYATGAGIAFQLQDDILGVFGDPAKTGKSDNSDLLQGKFTLLVAKCLSSGTNEQKVALTAVWGKRAADKENIEKAKQALIESGALAYCRDKAKSYATEAGQIIQELEKFGLNQEAYEFLKGVAEYMVNREV